LLIQKSLNFVLTLKAKIDLMLLCGYALVMAAKGKAPSFIHLSQCFPDFDCAPEMRELFRKHINVRGSKLVFLGVGIRRPCGMNCV
jgi:hypothetical protein